MAKRKRRSHRRRHTSGTTHRRRSHSTRRARRNPPASIGRLVSEFPAYALRTGMHAGEAVAGKIVARKVRGLTKQQPGSLVGSLIEAGVGLVGGFALSMLHPSLGEFFAVGGLMAPIETAVQRLGIPHVSDSLGDDGYYVGPGTGVTLVSSNPDDYQGVAGYVPGDGSVAGYVPGEGFDEFSASRSANNAA